MTDEELTRLWDEIEADLRFDPTMYPDEPLVQAHGVPLVR